MSDLKQGLGLEPGFDDETFDRHYPMTIQELSACHWTPVEIARCAARLLVTMPGTRVLDIGCGPGKFCMTGAMETEGHFTGVEQRGHLASLAKSLARKHGLSNVEILHANITDIDFTKYDAFYLFNPFEENTVFVEAIDSTVVLSKDLYELYTANVANQLSLVPLGTRVVTYMGIYDEIPDCYDLQIIDCPYNLKLWIKRRKRNCLEGDATTVRG